MISLSTVVASNMLEATDRAVEETLLPWHAGTLGAVDRDVALCAGLAAALGVLADSIDKGPDVPLPPSVYSALIREYAADFAGAGRGQEQ
jgi:hypothetical protein